MNTAVKVFYSYASADESLQHRLQYKLEQRLRTLKKKDSITGWHDRQIITGTDWSAQVDVRLNSASIILLLISPDFLASDYCYSEMQRALERHQAGEACVIPVLTRPVDWQQSPLRDLQALPLGGKPITMWSDRDDAFNNVVQGILQAIEALASKSATDQRTAPDQEMMEMASQGDDFEALHDLIEQWMFMPLDELSSSERTAFNTHVKSCSRCAALYANYQQTRTHLRALPPVAPLPSFASLQAKSQEKRRYVRWPSPAVLGFVFLVLTAVATIFLQSGSNLGENGFVRLGATALTAVALLALCVGMVGVSYGRLKHVRSRRGAREEARSNPVSPIEGERAPGQSDRVFGQEKRRESLRALFSRMGAYGAVAAVVACFTLVLVAARHGLVGLSTLVAGGFLRGPGGIGLLVAGLFTFVLVAIGASLVGGGIAILWRGRIFIWRYIRKYIRVLAIALVLLMTLYFSARLIGSKIIEGQMKSYTPFSDESPIAQLSVTTTNTNLKWKVQVSTYNSSGNLVASPQAYLEPCDHWVVKANIISIPSWLALGVPSGWYMLTDLEGSHCYGQRGNLTTSIEKIPLDRSPPLKTQDGGFLNSVKSIPVASASIQPDGKTYNVIITPTSVLLTPTG